ncbi:MAG TPA: NAD-dependent epimerase/dehydratase family protein [Pseudoxanthomonas sp.]|nr:NAD-dependent epimerase/dehydratase family protein [Pseudoxanthomonas sp.]
MRILITGANGLVGQGVLRECLRDPAVSRIVALGRKPSGASDARLVELACADFADLSAVEDQLHPFDVCLYCAGAPPLGTPEADYRHVTVALTTHVAATLARLNPGIVFLYISGAHADPASRLMPLRIKGEAERALAALPIRTVMLRPGGIQPVQGVRSPHPAMAAMYTVAGPLMGLGARLLPGVMTTTAHVGRAMLALLKQEQPPAVVENAEINRLAD